MARWLPFVVLCCSILPGGCAEQKATKSSIGNVAFATSLDKNFRPVGETSKFSTDAKQVYLSVTIDGRPETGIVKAAFRLRDQEITTAQYDLADANSGVFASIGQNTYVGFTLTPTKPFPISDQYRADLFLNDEKIGTYPFEIVPPEGATPSKILKTGLARGVTSELKPTEPARSFGVNDAVHLVGRGTFGNRTWIEARWTVGDSIDDKATRSLTMQENIKETGFHFSWRPKDGWPKGKHKVTLIMNDREVGVHEFTIE